MQCWRRSGLAFPAVTLVDIHARMCAALGISCCGPAVRRSFVSDLAGGSELRSGGICSAAMQPRRRRRHRCRASRWSKRNQTRRRGAKMSADVEAVSQAGPLSAHPDPRHLRAASQPAGSHCNLQFASLRIPGPNCSTKASQGSRPAGRHGGGRPRDHLELAS
jgi:hypothetical protein